MGVPQVERALRRRRAHLVLLATDGSAGQKQSVIGLTRGQRLPMADVGTRDLLASWLGSGPLTAVAVLDSSLARGMLPWLPQIDPDPASEGNGCDDGA